MTDKRRAAIGEATTSCYALRFLRRFATGILEIGSRSERNAARVARNVATIDKRGARNVGMTDKRRAAIGEATTSCYALRFLRRFATGILEIGSRSERNVARVARNVADDRQEGARNVGMTDKRRGDRGGDHELLRLALLAALRDGDFGDRQSVREERREGRQERRDDRQRGARNVGMTDKSRAATAIRIETAGRCGHKRTAETWGAVVDQRRRLIARA